MLIFFAFLALCCAQTEPWLPLHGGSFSKPPVPLSPDPLVSYVWNSGLADPESLQLYTLYPTSVTLSPATPQGSFSNLSSITSSPGAACKVSGAGGFSVDFGVESPAWVEFVSPDLSPADLPLLSLSLSEWAEALPNKWHVPEAIGGCTFRLHTNALLYEGIRFAFFNVSAPPTTPFTITSLRLSVQAKPVNYTGSFSSGDALMERVWWTGAYTVRANLEEDYIGAVLVDRGDRVGWTGDLHPSQATSMAAFGNFDFIRASLNSSKNNCNGIESYCVYWVLSLCDYYFATADAAALEYFTPFVEQKLGHARGIFPDLHAQWQFYGWDDRLVSCALSTLVRVLPPLSNFFYSPLTLFLLAQRKIPFPTGKRLHQCLLH
jgi:alpha-L-rhamnosidase